MVSVRGGRGLCLSLLLYVIISPAPNRPKRWGWKLFPKVMPWAKRSTICPLFSFPLSTTCHLKPPSNKLKEPWKVVGSIINQTHVSPGLPGRSRGFSASSTASQGHFAMLSTWMWPGGPGEAQWYPCDPSSPGFSRAWVPAMKVGWRWHSSSLTYPFWRPIGLCTQLSSSGDLWNRELTFCFWTSIVTMTMNYKLAHGQDSTEKMTPAGFWASSVKIDLILNCFMGHGYFCLKRSIHLPLLAEIERRKEQSRCQEAEMDGNIILMKTAAFLRNPHHFWALISLLKEQKITTIGRKRYFWEYGHPPLNWKDDFKNILESLSQCLAQSLSSVSKWLESRL